MIAAFLAAEIDSPRYAAAIRGMLERDGRGEDVLRRPVAADSAYRRRVLEEHRAYERREGLFLGFP